MPPAKDIIKRNVKEIYINPKDYIINASNSEEAQKDVISCPNCRTGGCYYCNGKGNRV